MAFRLAVPAGSSLRLLLGVAGVCLAATAAQAEQRELTLGLQPLYGLTYLDARQASGGGGNLHLGYGITDAVGVQILAGASGHPLSPIEPEDASMKGDPGGQLVTWHAAAGVVYALDVVRIVPFFEANIGVLGLYRSTNPTGNQKTPTIEHAINVGASLGLGADYLITRRWSVGVAIRYHAFLTDLARIPIYLTVGPRVSLRFGL
jgi:opacity protein-like surface antigen